MTLLEAVRPTPLTQLIYLPLILILHCIIGILETEELAPMLVPEPLPILLLGPIHLNYV